MTPIEIARTLSRELNHGCHCITLDRPALLQALETETAEPGLWDLLSGSHAHLFSATPLFVAREDVDGMRAVVRAVETAARLPGWIEAALARAPEIARFDPGTAGAFMGYDFHLGDGGPKLIEVNTNAGGAFLNALLARAQWACCGEAAPTNAVPPPGGFEEAVWRMFEAEWRRQRGIGTPTRVAIVDDEPERQFLHPEFLLVRRFFEARGVAAVILDPRALSFDGGHLLGAGRPIDLVYNRLVDFTLEQTEHGALRAAYLAGAAVVTPNPRVHALLADKRNLVALSDPERLAAWGLDDAAAALLADVVPRTVEVTPANADDLWQQRRELFFKPATGYGSKAAYRGDKLTKSVWARIAEGGYVAQRFAPPGERAVAADPGAPLKADVRLYTYGGEMLLAAARLYQGQTTNFRTPGGGFAPVFAVP
ncbi:hypothetical protein [Azospirillum sp.]|uniref:hypothetical protein n=1 Tax=Azospirillum sp. TaxID=34012 RepID=UPI003D72E38A